MGEKNFELGSGTLFANGFSLGEFKCDECEFNEGRYLICYECDDCEYARFKIVGGFNTNHAISNFYNTVSWSKTRVDIDDEMFYKLITNLSVEDAVRTHNAFAPSCHIICIYSISNELYCEADGKVEEQ